LCGAGFDDRALGLIAGDAADRVVDVGHQHGGAHVRIGELLAQAVDIDAAVGVCRHFEHAQVVVRRPPATSRDTWAFSSSTTSPGLVTARNARLTASHRTGGDDDFLWIDIDAMPRITLAILRRRSEQAFGRGVAHDSRPVAASWRVAFALRNAATGSSAGEAWPTRARE
jgi:hypothetical protein